MMPQYSKIKSKVVFFILFLVGVTPVIGQNLEQNWFFGANNVGVQFAKPNYKATLVSRPLITPYGLGAGAVASDKLTGDLLFYTDGNTVYDRNHAVMTGGTGLLGTTSLNQVAAICKIPNVSATSNSYYIFTNNAGTIQYSVVDMTLGVGFPAPPVGQVVSKNTNVPGLPAGLSQAMIVVSHANGEDFWLIVHDVTGNFYSVLINNAAGFTAGAPATAGLIQNPANFCYHTSTKEIAVSPKEINKNIEIVSFDNSTGAFALTQTIPNSSLTSLPGSGQAIYDAEWSKDGDYLYASVFGNAPTYPAQILQFDLVNSLTDPTLLPTPISTPAFTESYGLQMALDSNIYHLYKTGAVIKVGKILFTDSVASKVIYQPTPFSTVADFKSMQFPSFAPKDTTLVTLSFVPVDTCATNLTTFFPTVKPSADSLRWDFGDGSKATSWSPAHKYGSANTYTVKLVSFLNGDSTVFTRDVTIKQFSLSINLTSDTTACPSELPYPKTPGATGCTSGCFQLTAKVSGTASEIQWYGPAGKMNQTLTLSPDSLGYYVLVVGDGTGCETHSYTNIKEYGLQDQENAMWTFGDHAGIDFNPTVRPIPKPAVAISTALVDAPEGCSVVCDENGQIIIYTDGVNLYDRDKNDITPTPNPPGLGGNTGSTQSSLIVKSPADETLIYIFTTQEIDNGLNEVRYSLFDATKFDATHPYGSVVIYNQLLFSRATERLTSDGTWLLIHEFGNNAFRAYNLTGGNIGNPVITNIGSIHSFDNLEGGKGYMKFGPSPLLAVPINTPGVSNVIELFDFDATTGTLSNYRVADTKNANGEIYGVEFIGNKLFATLRGTPTSQLVEFFIDYKKKPQLLTTPVLPPTTGELGAIQTAPNQQTYIAINGSSSLATITLNADTTKTSTIQLNAAPALVGGTSSNLGLPNIVNNHSNNFQTPTINVAGVCLGSKTVFTGTGTDVIDTLTWHFDDGSSEVRLSTDTTEVSRTFTTTGKHTVILKITNRCVGLVKQFSQDFIINPLPPDPTATTFLCDTNVTLDANPSNTSGLTYLWVTTDTTRKISVNRTGIFGVQLTSSAGCIKNGNLTVSPGLPSPFDLGRDSSLCALSGATKVLTTNINIPNSNAWTKNGVAFGNTTQVTADLSTVGTWKYKVTFTSPLSGCKTSDSVTFIVKQPPVLSLPLTFTNPTTCNSTDGSIRAQIIAPSVSSDVFSYTLTPSGASGSIPYNVLTLLSNTLAAGTYTATVTDNINNCSAPGVQTLTAPGSPVVTPSQVGTCDPIKLRFSATGPTTGTYRIINNTTGVVVESGSFTSFPVTSTNAVPAGTYIVEVTTATCTSSSSPFAIVPSAPLVINFDNSAICSGQLTANVTPAATINYDWSGSTAGSLPNMAINAATVTINNSSTPWNMVLKVTDTGGANCPATGTFLAQVDNITPDFTNTTCTNPIVLSATPKGSSYIYAWSINSGAPQAGTDNFNAIVSANYQVIIQGFNGCPAKTSSAHSIDPNLLGPITVLLDNVAPCKGTPFDLTAVPSRTTATMSYTWTLNGTAIANSQDKNPLTGNTKTGTYAVTVFDGTCSDDATLALATLLDPTEGALKPSDFICPEGGETLTLDPDPDNTRNFIEFTWSVDGVEPSGNTDQTYVATMGGTYSVTLKNILNCISTDKTIVVEECDPDLNAPKAFKPSSSIAENVEFYVFPHFVDEQGFQVFIFNRWGEMVYQSNDLGFKWNGNFNNSGAALPPGTYSWVAKYKSKYRPQDGIKEKHGGVLLLR